MAHSSPDQKISPQMTATIPNHTAQSREMPQHFGRIGIPALAAAAEIVKSNRKAEKPFHADFYRQFVD